MVVAAAGLVGIFDAILSARVRAGTDSALRLSVILPYLGVDRAYVLARALGLAALVLAALLTALGLGMGARRAGGHPVPERLSLWHRQGALLVIGLVLAHALVPFASAVPPFGGWATALVPFHQPVFWGRTATIAQTAGIVAFYLLVLLGPTYYLLRRRRRMWGMLHPALVVVYLLAAAHALFLGSDFYVAGPLRVALIAAQVPISAMVAWRLALSARRSARPARAWVGMALATAGSLAAAVLAGLGATGAALGGFRL
jgi:predicted ferric reductase